jgi:hypothetical protein
MTISISGSGGITFPDGSNMSVANVNSQFGSDISISGGVVTLTTFKTNVVDPIHNSATLNNITFDGTKGLTEGLGQTFPNANSATNG